MIRTGVYGSIDSSMVGMVENILDVAEIIVTSAMDRKESRGLHYSLDYPARSSIKADTVIRKK